MNGFNKKLRVLVLAAIVLAVGIPGLAQAGNGHHHQHHQSLKFKQFPHQHHKVQHFGFFFDPFFFDCHYHHHHHHNDIHFKHKGQKFHNFHR